MRSIPHPLPLSLVMVIILLVPITFTVQSTNDHSEMIPDDTPWYENWMWDADRSGIDDRLEALPTGSFENIFIDYDHHPSQDDRTVLEEMGLQVHYVASAIDTIVVNMAPVGTLHMISTLQGVIMIEMVPPADPLLDVAVPNLKARSSTQYQPTTAWDLGYRGDGVAIAIIDGGVDDLVHESLRFKFVGGADFTGPVQINNTNPDDGTGHGTMCAGVAVGSGGNSQQYMGFAPNASLVDLKVYVGGNTGGNVISALDWCIENMESLNLRVASISMSFGGSDGKDAISREVDAATEAGLVVIASVGNDASHQIPSPSAADGCIAAGASDDHGTIDRGDDTIAGFSNYGPRNDDGDSDDMDELKPDIVAPGKSITTALFNTIGSYTTVDGTSFSTPATAGVVAMMLQANPDLDPYQVKQILKETAEARGSPDYPNLSSKYDTRFGFGLVDAYGAVKRALDLKSGTMDGPESIGSDQTGYFTSSFSFTRTEFTTETDSIQVTVKVPNNWDSPGGINLNPGGSLASSTSHDTPTEQGGMWMFHCWFNYTGIPNSPTTLNPQVTFQSVSPVVSGSDNFQFVSEFSLNGIYGDTASHTMNRQENGEVDLFVLSEGIGFSNPSPIPEEIITISAIIWNGGTTNVTSVQVNFTDGPPATGIDIGKFWINVPGHGNATAQINWEATPGHHNIYVEVDPADLVNETNEFNNTAFKSINVVSEPGEPPITNLPPVASLTVTPSEAGVDQLITFDGRDSYDPDGAVVYYHFDFGDDTNITTTDSVVYHSYATEDRYFPRLIVIDNGNSQSAPDTAMVDVTTTESGEVKYWCFEDYRLTTLKPGGSRPLNDSCPNTGIGKVLVWKEVARWTSEPIAHTIELQGPVVFSAWLVNWGDVQIENARLQFELLHDGNTVIQDDMTEFNFTVGAEPKELILESDLPRPVEVKFQQSFELIVRVQVREPGLQLLYGASNSATGFSSRYIAPVNDPPHADAGVHINSTAGDPTQFNGQGNDSDGNIVLYEWDFDSDTETDYQSSSSGVTTHTYNETGDYEATLTVWDDDGSSAMDTVTVHIVPPPVNDPPGVSIQNPKYNQTVEGVVEINGTAWDDYGVTYVEIKFDSDQVWQKASGTTVWSYMWDTTAVTNGLHMIDARAFDGAQYSTPVSVPVNVLNKNEPPAVNTFSVDPEKVTNDGLGKVTFTVKASDPDGLFDIEGVTIDLTSLGGGTKEMSGDGDGEYTYIYTIPAGTPPGKKTIEATVRDLGGETDSDTESLVVEAANGPPLIEAAELDMQQVSNNGSIVTLTVRVDDPEGLGDIKSVTVDLGEVGGSSSTTMEKSGDGTFTIEIKVLPTVTPGTKKLTVTVSDKGGETVQKIVDLDVTMAPKDEGEDETQTDTDGNSWLPGFQGYVILVALLSVLLIIGTGRKDVRRRT